MDVNILGLLVLVVVIFAAFALVKKAVKAGILLLVVGVLLFFVFAGNDGFSFL